MKPPQHFALCFLGPIVTSLIYCASVWLLWDWLQKHQIPPLVTMLVGGVIVAGATRWYIRNFVAVKCPFCGGESYEIPGRGNRFMCRVCGKDH